MNIHIKEQESNQSLVDVDSTTQSLSGLSFLEKYDRFKLIDDTETDVPVELPNSVFSTACSLVCTNSIAKNKSHLSTGLPRRLREKNFSKSSLIEKLAQIRNTQNSNDTATFYGDILDFIEANTAKFECNIGAEDFINADFNMLTEKMDSVGNARDKCYQVQQQVKDLIEQLELVERYKMESVD